MSQKRAKKVMKRAKKKSKKNIQAQKQQKNSTSGSLNIFSSDTHMFSQEGRRFSSLNKEYNSAYDYSEKLQKSSGIKENSIKILDEDGPIEVLSILSSLVEKGILTESKYEKFTRVYQDFLATWCINLSKNKPEEPAPYMDWWQQDSSLVSLTKDKILIERDIPEEMKDKAMEAMTSWIASEIMDNKSLYEEVDDFVFCNDSYIQKYHGTPWQERAEIMRDFLNT